MAEGGTTIRLNPTKDFKAYTSYYCTISPNIIKDDCFKIVETLSTGNQKYDSWVRTDQFRNTDAEARQLIINSISYSWVSADQRSLLPDQYSELTIQKI